MFKFILFLSIFLFVNAQEDVTTSTTTTNTVTPIFIPKPNTTVCYDVVGCFSNNYPFNNTSLYVPIAPEDLKTGFKLYTNLNNDDTDELSYLDEESVRSSRYNKKYPLKILIHGFQNSGLDQWIIDIANKIITKEKGKVNVVIVDWKLGAEFPNYFNASSNIRLVGAQLCILTKMIRKIFYEDAWTNEFNIHCIGHSLGAHTCAMASNACENIYDRITALDPAGPNFEGYDNRTRVDMGDAKFVDVIHSNGDNFLLGNLGMSTPAGHVDFYPNGGKQQPGCPSLATLITGLLSNVSGSISGVSCSHARAILFFEESILSPCTFLSYPCINYAAFEKGDCLDCSKGGCTFMGYYTSPKSRGIKYAMTKSDDPYCAYPYLVEVHVSNLVNRTAGEILVWFVNGKTNASFPLTKTTDDITSNFIYRKLFSSELDIAYADNIYIQFTKKNRPFFGIDPNYPAVYIDKVKIIHGEVDDEIYSQCMMLGGQRIEDKQRITLNLKLVDCVKLESSSLLNKLIN